MVNVNRYFRPLAWRWSSSRAPIRRATDIIRSGARSPRHVRSWPI